MPNISLSVSKQIGIANYKASQTQSSGIEALHVITPVKDSVTGLLILAIQKPGLNRVKLHPAADLSLRGITETAAQAKYISDTATLKSYFGLSNVGDSAAAMGLPQVRLDEGGVYLDPQVASFPTPSFASTAVENKISSDGNHLWMNYFNPVTGTFDAVPGPLVTGNQTPGSETKTFLGLTSRQWTIGGVIAGLATFIIWDPRNMIWNRKKGQSKSKSQRYS